MTAGLYIFQRGILLHAALLLARFVILEAFRFVQIEKAMKKGAVI